MPVFCAIFNTSASRSRSRNAAPSVPPDVGSVSRYRALASFAVFNAYSALVPPITTPRWYGGHAAVPSVRIFSSIHVANDAGLSSALVSWNSRLLLAEPPPLAMKKNLYSPPGVASISISAGRFVPVFVSSHMFNAVICE